MQASTIQKEVNQILNQFAEDQKITVPVYYHLNTFTAKPRKCMV